VANEVNIARENWVIQFNAEKSDNNNPVRIAELKSWTSFTDAAIKFYSGTAIYSNTFECKGVNQSAWLEIDSLYNIATVKINGIYCGTIWTEPYTLDITNAVRSGRNTLEIAVTNTWHNRLIGDALLTSEKRTTWTTAPFRLKDKPLLPAGIVGNVRLYIR
jgi:hypothetical protein